MLPSPAAFMCCDGWTASIIFGILNGSQLNSRGSNETEYGGFLIWWTGRSRN